MTFDRTKANCKDKNVSEFYVDNGPISSRNVRISIDKAVAYCRNCSERADCLALSINNKEQFGIWGGFTARERAAIVINHDVVNITKIKAQQIINKGR